MNRDTAVLQISAASTGYNLPTTIIKRYKAKSKTNHDKKQIQKRNMNGEGGHLADANGSRRNVKFGSLQYFKFQQLPQDITCQQWYFIITKRNPKPNILRDKYKNAIWTGGTSPTPTEAHARNAEFGWQIPSFGNIRSAVGNRRPSTRSIVRRLAEV